MTVRQRLRGAGPQLSASVPVSVLSVGVALALVLESAQTLGLTTAQTSSLILGFFGIPGLLGVLSTLRHRVPLIWTGHVLVLILFASVASDLTFAEMVGASMVAGGIVVVLGAAGITGRVTDLMPPQIVAAVIAGAVLPFVARMFSALGTDTAIAGSAAAAFVLSQMLFGNRFPALLPALGAGVVAAMAGGRFGDAPPALTLPEPILVTPQFSVQAIAATVPIIVVLMTLSANIPSIIYLRGQGFDPPERLINIYSGGATILGAPLSPLAVCLPTPPIAMLAGPDAGPLPDRHRSVYFASVAIGLIALGASTAARLAAFVPPALIATLAGLALLNVLVTSLEDALTGPLKLGPIIAFSTTLSDLSLGGLGPIFWALALGTGVSWLVEDATGTEATYEKD